MPFPGGTQGAHDDGSHQGTAKRNIALGVAGLDATGIPVDIGGGQVEVRTRRNVAGGYAGLDGGGLVGLIHLLTNVYVGELTRDMTAATGNVEYTGVGFQPRLLIFWGGVTDTRIYSMLGAATLATGKVFSDSHTITANSYKFTDGNICIALIENITTTQLAKLVATSVDGFTLYWSKGGTPSAGTATICFIAVR